jgi:hypothetical protein
MINIDELALKQVRELSALFSQTQAMPAMLNLLKFKKMHHGSGYGYGLM